MISVIATTILIVLPISLFLRLFKVSEYRRMIIEKIAANNLNDINNHIILDFSLIDKRWKKFDSVSFDEMMIKFWKPIESFWDGWQGE